MSLKSTDKLIAPPRITVDMLNTLVGKLQEQTANNTQFVKRLVYWCAIAGIDDGDALAQWLVETANGTSVRWKRDNNPGGVGIPADSTVQPFIIANVEEAAQILVQAIYASVTRNLHSNVPIPVAAKPWFDGVWLPKVNHPNYPGVTIVDDLNTRYTANGDSHATWAWDENYITTMIGRAKTYLPAMPDQGGTDVVDAVLTYGKVPHPAYQNRPIWKTEGVGMNNLGKRTVKGVSWHRILGSLWGTDGFFRDPSVAALTDYGVGVLAQDGAAHDGEILRWNDPLGYQSGWASGTYSAAHAYGDGAAFVDKYGVNAINRDRASIEISGFQTTPLSQKAKEAIAGLTAYWADQYQVPWTDFPYVPWDGFSFVVWHEEFGPDNGTKKCPFDAVKAVTDEMIGMTKEILKTYQTQSVVEPPPTSGDYATPVTYPWLAQDDGKVHVVGSTRVLPLSLTFTAVVKTPRYQRGSNESEKIGEDIPKGTKFKAHHVFRGKNKVTYVITPHGSRVKARALMPRVQITESGRISVRHDGSGAVEVISDHVDDEP